MTVGEIIFISVLVLVGGAIAGQIGFALGLRRGQQEGRAEILHRISR